LLQLALRALGGVLILRFYADFELLPWFEFFLLFLALSCHFSWLYRFSCLLFAFAVFLILDNLLELFFGFLGLPVCFMGSWIQTSNFVLLLSMDSSRGRLRNQVVSSLV
jgi:hypothetical protein